MSPNTFKQEIGERSACRPTGVPTVGMLLAFALFVTSGCSPWRSSSARPPEPLDHPLVESLEVDGEYRFAAFGDQRALVEEWRTMMPHIAGLASEDSRLLFMVDTGDIVKNGSHSDQFWMLRDILSPVNHLPYLVGVGNHEVHDNDGDRRNAATFLGYLGEDFSPQRMYYRKDIGPARFLFLDTNDLIYGDRGAGKVFSRSSEQMQWLIQELDNDTRGPGSTTVAVMHHPFVQSSDKHRDQALQLWNFEYQGQFFPELLLAGGVDIVLTGHTHTYERFILERDQQKMQVVNLSGRPVGMTARSRRAANLGGREKEELLRHNWSRLDDWEISQEESMPADREADQFAVITVGAAGNVSMKVYFLDDDSETGIRETPSVELKQ
jgi:hypothetical protein